MSKIYLQRRPDEILHECDGCYFESIPIARSLCCDSECSEGQYIYKKIIPGRKKIYLQRFDNDPASCRDRDGNNCYWIDADGILGCDTVRNCYLKIWRRVIPMRLIKKNNIGGNYET